MVRTFVMPGLMALLGVAIVVRTIVSGGGPGTVGILVGLLFVAAGAGRIWAEHRRG